MKIYCGDEGVLQCYAQLLGCIKIDLVTKEWLCHFRNLRQHRGQHSPSGTVAFEQGIMGQDTFLQMVTEFCRVREQGENRLLSILETEVYKMQHFHYKAQHATYVLVK